MRGIMREPEEVDLGGSGGSSDWVLVLRQVIKTQREGDIRWWKAAECASVAANDPTAENYSRLGELEGHRNRRNGGLFELRLSWPGTQIKPQHWLQRSNPFVKQSRGVQGDFHKI